MHGTSQSKATSTSTQSCSISPLPSLISTANQFARPQRRHPVAGKTGTTGPSRQQHLRQNSHDEAARTSSPRLSAARPLELPRQHATASSTTLKLLLKVSATCIILFAHQRQTLCRVSAPAEPALQPTVVPPRPRMTSPSSRIISNGVRITLHKQMRRPIGCLD